MTFEGTRALLAALALLLPAGAGPAPAQERTNRDQSGYTELHEPGFPIRSGLSVVPAAQSALHDDDLVLGVVVAGEARAYPVNLMWEPQNEALNDTLGGEAIAATWCPIAHSGVVYDRALGGRTVELGAVGLEKGVFILYDRQTGTRWSQVSGRATRGRLEGQVLRKRDSTMTTWGRWRGLHSDTTVYVNATLPVRRRFTEESMARITLGGRGPVVNEDLVAGIEGQRRPRAYLLRRLAGPRVVNDTLDGEPVVVFLAEDAVTVRALRRAAAGRTLTFAAEGDTLVDAETGSRWDPMTGRALSGPLAGRTLDGLVVTTALWYAWRSQRPETSLWEGPAAAPPAEGGRAALARAVALHQKGDLEAAVAAYREILALAPSVEGRSNLGAALAALGRYQEAIEAYRGALAMAPADGRIRYNLALAHYKSADLPRAVEELEALRARQPDDLRATLLLADCRLQMGEPAAVEALLRPLAASRPDDRAVTYLLGMALVRGGKVEEGQRLVEALVRDGDSPEAQYLVGSAAFMAGDYPQAVERFSRALEKSPDLPSLRSYYGRALLFTGDADGAERAFREALAASPNDYEANYFLGSVLATRGRPNDARPFVERAVELRPQSEQAKELLASLDSPAKAAARPDVSPLVGQPAPDVELLRPDGSGFRLSSLRGGPLVLVLGSYTCPQLRHGAPAVNRLHSRYGDRARFLLAYLREAHPAGEAWESTINRREGISLPEARSVAERAEHAALCRRELKIPYEAALDGLDGKAEAALSAFPSRVFVIDAGGTVTFSSALDVESFREDALEAAIVAAMR